MGKVVLSKALIDWLVNHWGFIHVGNGVFKHPSKIATCSRCVTASRTCQWTPKIKTTEDAEFASKACISCSNSNLKCDLANRLFVWYLDEDARLARREIPRAANAPNGRARSVTAPPTDTEQDTADKGAVAEDPPEPTNSQTAAPAARPNNANRKRPADASSAPDSVQPPPARKSKQSNPLKTVPDVFQKVSKAGPKVSHAPSASSAPATTGEIPIDPRLLQADDVDMEQAAVDDEQNDGPEHGQDGTQDDGQKDEDAGIWDWVEGFDDAGVTQPEEAVDDAVDKGVANTDDQVDGTGGASASNNRMTEAPHPSKPPSPPQTSASAASASPKENAPSSPVKAAPENVPALPRPQGRLADIPEVPEHSPAEVNEPAQSTVVPTVAASTASTAAAPAKKARTLTADNHGSPMRNRPALEYTGVGGHTVWRQGTSDTSIRPTQPIEPLSYTGPTTGIENKDDSDDEDAVATHAISADKQDRMMYSLREWIDEEVRPFSAKVAAKEKTIDTQDTRIKQLEAELVQAREDHKSRQNEVANYKQLVDTRDARIKELEGKLVQSRADHTSLQNDVADQKKRVRQVNAAMEAKQLEIKGLKDQVANLEARLAVFDNIGEEV